MFKKNFGKGVGVLALSSVLLTGCGGNDSADGAAEAHVENTVGAMESFEVGDTFKATEPIEIPMLFRDHPNMPVDNDWTFFSELEEITNVTFDLTTVPLSDFEQRRSVLVSGGQAPLIIPQTPASAAEAFIPSGAVLPISDYIEYMPHFMNRVEEWGLEEDLDNIRQEDGKFYVLPGLLEDARPEFTLAIRQDIFDKHDIAIPETWDELQDALATLKEIYPDSIPYSDRWEMNATLRVAGPTFGTVGGWTFGDGLVFDEEKDEFVFAAATEEYRQMLEFFNGLVADGLMDPESLTQDCESAIQKFVSGQSFVIGGSGIEIHNYRTSMNQILGEGNFEVSLISVPAGPAGPMMEGERLENGIMFMREAAENENFIAMLQFIDWLYFSDEGAEFSMWGIEGETFARNEDGYREPIGNYNLLNLNPDGDDDLRVNHGFANGVFMMGWGGSTDLQTSTMNEEAREFFNTMHETRTPVSPQLSVPLSTEAREQKSLLGTSLTDFAQQGTFQFILGQRDISEFDSFVEELEAMGLSRYLDITNDAFRAQNN